MTTQKISLVAAGRIIDHVGENLYGSFEKALSELIINGYDADATQVDVLMEKNRITVRDNGSGMSVRNIQDYCLLGGNTKRAGKSQRTDKFKRAKIGEKDIGKAAIFALGRVATITTRKDGKCHAFTLDKGTFETARTLEDASFDLKTSPGRGQGTTIVIYNLSSEVLRRRMKDAKLRAYLAREIPRTPDFTVTVNGEPCTIADIPAESVVPINLKLKLCGQVTGKIIVAKKMIDEPGMTITVRGRTVGKPTVLGLEEYLRGRSVKGMAFRFITGEVEVPGFDPEDKKTRPIILSSREGFRTDDPRWTEFMNAVQPILRKVILEKEKAIDRENGRKNVKHVQEMLKDVIKALNQSMRDLPNLFDEELDEKRDEPGTETPGGEMEKAKGGAGGGDTGGDNDDAKEKKPNIVDKPEDKKGADNLPGDIRIGSRQYQLFIRPLGEESYECVLSEATNEIIINSDHVNFSLLSEVRPEFPLLYRMVIGAIVAAKTTTAKEAAHYFDQLSRRRLPAA